MKRQKKIKNMKIRLPSFLDGVKKIVFKMAIAGAIIFIFSAISLVSVKAFLYKSNYFRLRTVESKDAAFDELLSRYKGKNVFKIDLKSIEDAVKASYPDAKEVRIRIVLPDKISVSLKFRKPVAFIGGSKYYPVDEEGFIIPRPETITNGGLPVITGVDIRYEERRGGKSVSKNLKIALGLLKEMKRSKFMARHSVATIEAGDVKNLSFYLKNGPEVKIGDENFRKRLELLEETLKDPRLLIDKIRYIDVRFEDAVISPK